MTTPTQAPIDDHHVRVDWDANRWSCRCGDAGSGSGELDAGVQACAHVAAESRFLLPRLAPQQLAALLRAGAAGDTSRVAAVELLIAHGHWLGYGGLRRFVTLHWEPDRCTADLDWLGLREALGEAARAVQLLRYADAPPATLAALQGWLAGRGIKQLQGSTSELAVLRVAASVAGGYQISLALDLSNLAISNRGQVLTAVGHLLSRGGAVPLHASPTWQPRQEEGRW